MNLRSPDPYWLYQTPFLNAYNCLTKNLQTEVAIIGGGISGALAAYELTKAGCMVALITGGHIDTASTCASTALLQYEIDTPLFELIKKTGEQTAVKSYLLCHDAIDELEKIHAIVGISKVFERRKSLLLASAKKDVHDLEKECEARVNAGINAGWLTAQQIENMFGFKAPAAIYSTQGAQTDAYLLTQKIIKWCFDRGMKVYDKTEISDVNSARKEVALITKQGYKITAKYVVMATGYDATKWIDYNVARLHSTYVIISEPVDVKQLWSDKCLIWETAKPYTYMRITNNNRIIVGGKDDTFSSAGKRDALIAPKSKQLEEPVKLTT